jgi:ATP-dependent Clp protease ATP-binding subunit ClpB
VRRDRGRRSASYDLERAAELQHGACPSCSQRLAAEEALALGEEPGRPPAPRGGHRGRDRRDRRPLDRHPRGTPASEGEREKLLRLEERCTSACRARTRPSQLVADAVIRARAGIKDPRRPIGSFIFLGPTGVGKTELARALAESLFDDEDNMSAST